MARPRVTGVDVALDAAGRVLVAKGIAATTVEDVAAEAGVSRATVYRYLGGKDEIVGAVIARETRALLAAIEGLVAEAGSPGELIEHLVATAVDVVRERPLLSRLNNEDRRETLPFITVDGAGLIDGVVETLGPVIRDNVTFEYNADALDTALEEITRLVLSHLTTPRRDGQRLDPAEFSRRVATMIQPLLDP
ncbi:MAG: helix-turn-helix transcriptional regulator [Actinomycetia bacterium]|nr:helix-turn-helix transcriptional regulator [Actinomycetes bacterium]